MSRKKIIIIHVFIWLFALFANLPYVSIDAGMPPRQIVTYIIAFLYLMVVFYLFYFFLAPIFLNRKKLAAFSLISFFVVLIMPFFGYLLLFLTRALFDGTFSHFFKGYSLRMHMSGYFPVMTAAVFGSFFRAIINWFDTMNQKTETEKQKLAAELELIKSKLNPHFLFNTLNNIDSLIQKDPEKASSVLIKLSDVMRYLTYEASSEYVELGRETEYIRNLIDLYRIRIKSPDDIRFVAEGDMSAMISPALFIPLIENAFKFSSFRNNRPAIDIFLSSEGGIIVFDIKNYFDGMTKKSEDNHSGYGLINLEKRLMLTYPDRHSLSIEKGEQLYHAKLTLNINENIVHHN